MGCQQCNSIGGLVDLNVNVTYPFDKVKEGDSFNIGVDLMFTGPHILSGTFQICIYESNQLKKSESVNFSWLGYNETISRSYSFYMGSKDMNFNVSVIDVGLIYDTCENFSVFTVYRSSIIPPGTKYSCPGMGKTCIPDPNSQYSLAECIAQGCTGTGGGGGGGGGKCTSDQISIFGSCQKKSDVFIAAGAVVLLMMLSR